MKGAVPVGVCGRCLMVLTDKHPSCIKTGTILLWNMREAGRVNRAGATAAHKSVSYNSGSDL